MQGVTRPDARSATRVVGIDLARCVALLGMMATHILNPFNSSGGLAWPQALAGGRASALFAVLAGVSVSFMTGRQHPHAGEQRLRDAAGLAARALFIGGVGVVLSGLDVRVSVILTYYAVLFLLGIPFLGKRCGTLVALSALWCVAAPMASHVIRGAWGEQTSAAPSAEGLQAIPTAVMDLLFTGHYPAVPWLTYLLVGMAIGRLDLSLPATAGRVLAVGALLAGGAWGLSRALTSLPAAQKALIDSAGATGWDDLVHLTSVGVGGTTPTDTWWWLTTMSPHSGTPLDLAHTTGTALVVIGVALLLARWRPSLWAVPFGAGAMTLTLYSLHVAMLTPSLWPQQSVANYARHVLLVLTIGAFFALAGQRGPLETAARFASTLGRRAVARPTSSRTH